MILNIDGLSLLSVIKEMQMFCQEQRLATSDINICNMHISLLKFMVFAGLMLKITVIQQLMKTM